MNPGGVVIVLAGIWLGCQVFGGNALERLGIISTPGQDNSPMPPASGAVAVAPAGGAPNPTIWT